MPICPSCNANLSEWARRIETAERPPSTPKVWTCPECDAVLGVSDWGARGDET